MRHSILSRRGSLLAAASILGFTVSTPAFAQIAEEVSMTTFSEESPDIIVRSDLSPNTAPPAGTLDSGVTGVGQQIAFIQPANSPNSASLSLCSGTLINPRTVITAAHCVNARPAHMYGSNTGTGGGTYGAFGVTQGVPLSFGFNATNRCTGTATNPGNGCLTGTGAYETWRNSVFQTQVSNNIYNANQVWYDPRSQAPNSSGFLQADIALITLDTPALGIPTWAMLFSPLDGPTNSLQIGYGVNGTHASAQGTGCPAPYNACSPLGAIDYRRRSAENIISFLGSLDDRNNWLYGPGYVNNPANLYMLSFSDPGGVYDPATGRYDFGIFGGPSRGDAPRTREGITAGGDSGGPLVVESKYSQQVVAAVLSGGSRFFNAQRFSTYGTNSFYQPLHAYWQTIVANNPYVYAGNLSGNGNWEDASHWVQLMDPNYMIDVGGALVNSLPNTPEEGVSGSGAKFGYVCFLEDCTQYDQAAPTGSGDYLVVAGGPGSINFVPNNVEPVNSATPGATVRARYYDVTLAASGTTTLGSSVTIDRMTVDGTTKLNVASSGSLNVHGEYSQFQGWTNVDGAVRSGHDMMVLSGLLSGSGTITAPYLTVVGGIVAPGGNGLGNLTVQGDMVLASASTLNISVAPEFSDKLLVTANASAGTAGILALDQGSVMFTRAAGVTTPKYGGTWTIASAQGGVDGTFGSASAGPGVVKVKLTYTANDVIASLSASSFNTVLIGASPAQLALANALDTLRSSNYTGLWNLYGNIDWMGSAQLSATFDALTPRVLGDVEQLHERQSDLLLGSVGDRLSLLAGGRAQGLTMTGNPMAAAVARTQGVQAAKLGFGASNGGGTAITDLPGEMTGFVSGGTDRTRASYGHNDQGGWHMAMGLESPLGSNASFGTAVGFAEGESSPGNDSNESRTSMAAAYAAVDLGDGFYAGGLVAAESSRASIGRESTDGTQLFRLTGATSATRYSAVVEAGYATGIGRGLTLTPRAQLGYSRYTLNGFEEKGGETALELEEMTVSRIEARLGAKLDGTTRFAGVAVTPQLSADYVTLLAGRETGATVRFAAAPDEAFYLPLGYASSGWAEVKGGVTFGDGPFTLGLSGQHAVGAGEMSDQRAQADIRFRF